MRPSLSLTLAAAILSAASVTTVFAQPAPGAGPGGPRFENRAFSRPSERVEARLAYVKTALKITDAQQQQWDAYAAAVRKEANAMDQRMQTFRQERGARRERPNAVERLERLQSFHTEAANRINELLSAEKPLYAALSPEQKRLADEVLMPRNRGMMQRGGFRRG